MLDSGATPNRLQALRGKSTARTSTTVSSPGVMVKSYAPLVEGLLSSARNRTPVASVLGLASQNLVKRGNSSGLPSAPVSIASPRAERP